jgi:hypothetical protein
MTHGGEGFQISLQDQPFAHRRDQNQAQQKQQPAASDSGTGPSAT